MLIIDDLLASPLRGLLWIFKEIHDQAQQELAGEGEQVTAELTELYMHLETGQISESEFDAREKELLDRLERVQKRGESVQEKKNKKTGTQPRSKIKRNARVKAGLPAPAELQ